MIVLLPYRPGFSVVIGEGAPGAANPANQGGVPGLACDVNGPLKRRAAPRAFDCDGQCFEWVEVDNANLSIIHFCAAPASGSAAWSELLNSESHHDGSSNWGNALDLNPVRYQPGRRHQQRPLCLLFPPPATLIRELQSTC